MRNKGASSSLSVVVGIAATSSAIAAVVAGAGLRVAHGTGSAVRGGARRLLTGGGVGRRNDGI